MIIENCVLMTFNVLLFANLMFQDSMFDSQPQSRATTNGSQRSASTSASMRKAPSATNIGDDLSDLFGGTSLP
jgi:hypothetical protein